MGGRSSSSGLNSGLPNKTPLINTEEYQGYARELADLLKGDEVYQIRYNGGKAFADVRTIEGGSMDGDLRIDYIGSTGNRAGSELMARIAQKALTENRNLSWIADDSSAKSFYSSLGLVQKSSSEGIYLYQVSPEKLPSLIKRLRGR